MRRTDTDNTAGAPPPPALKGAAPSPGGAELTRRSELEKSGGGRGGLSCTRRGFRDENRWRLLTVPPRPEIPVHPFSTRQGNFAYMRYCLFSSTFLRFLWLDACGLKMS